MAKENEKSSPETQAASPPRIGIYICRCGGNISDVVRVEEVAAAARELPGVVVAKVETFLCSDPGQQTITEDIRKENLDRVAVACCSPSLHELTFRGAIARGGLNPYLYEHVNIREQCSWAHPHDRAGATSKATRLIAAGAGKLARAKPLEQIRLPNHRRALVVGGGPAGMKAAAELAGFGIPVLLVERETRLGGWLNHVDRVFPSEEPARELLARLEADVRGSSRVEVLLGAEVTAVSGFIGNFQATISGALGPAGSPIAVSATVGVIVMATGFEPYVPAEGEYLYRQSSRVVTMPEFLELMRQQPLGIPRLRFDGRDVRRVAFIHCVGSRQVDGVNAPQPDGKINAYCSRTCCTTTLQQAIEVRKRFPETAVFDFYQDIRTYGRGHEDYYLQASQSGVTFFRFAGDEPPAIESVEHGKNGGFPLAISVKDSLTWGEELRLEADLVVLATGMMANAHSRGIIEMLKLPTGDDRFLQEIHPKLRPVETALNGVLLAGSAQGPMPLHESLATAGAAAARAAALLRGDAVEVQPFVAAVDATRCEGAGLCVEECEYEGAIALVEQAVEGQTVRRAQVNPGLCSGCGACVAVCPQGAIELNGWRIDQYEAMIDGLVESVPEAAALTR